MLNNIRHENHPLIEYYIVKEITKVLRPDELVAKDDSIIKNPEKIIDRYLSDCEKHMPSKIVSDMTLYFFSKNRYSYERQDANNTAFRSYDRQDVKNVTFESEKEVLKIIDALKKNFFFRIEDVGDKNNKISVRHDYVATKALAYCERTLSSEIQGNINYSISTKYCRNSRNA